MPAILLPSVCLFSRGLYPFGQYISYTDHSFTIGEIKHLWRKNRCAQTYGRDLNVRVDNFENPSETNVLCSDWNSWKDPIIWLALHLQTNTISYTLCTLIFFLVPPWLELPGMIRFLAFNTCQTFDANHFKVLGRKYRDVGQSPISVCKLVLVSCALPCAYAVAVRKIKRKAN
jgi:hypothetical protein